MRELALHDEVGRLYARALVAIARADGDLVLDEILRLRALVVRRLGRELGDEALFGPTLSVDELVASVRRHHGDPFRSTALSPRQLGRLLIDDGLSLALADGHVCAEEVAMVEAMARSLDCTPEDLAEFRQKLPRWVE